MHTCSGLDHGRRIVITHTPALNALELVCSACSACLAYLENPSRASTQPWWLLIVDMHSPLDTPVHCKAASPTAGALSPEPRASVTQGCVDKVQGPDLPPKVQWSRARIDPGGVVVAFADYAAEN
jgi:hypothetical protein